MCMSETATKVLLQAKVERADATALAGIAVQNERTIAAEIRLAIRAHITKHNATRTGDQW